MTNAAAKRFIVCPTATGYARAVCGCGTNAIRYYSIPRNDAFRAGTNTTEKRVAAKRHIHFAPGVVFLFFVRSFPDLL